MNLLRLLLSLHSILLFSLLVFDSIASCQEVETTPIASKFALETLGEAEKLARQLPEKFQLPVLVRIAGELERAGSNAAAETLWSEFDKLIGQHDDPAYRDFLLAFLAQERARSGDLDHAKKIVNQMDPPAQHQAIQLVALELCEDARFKEAVIYAESIPRGSSILFDTMKKIGLASAKGGDTKHAFRASRGMNPGQGGTMAKKMRVICLMCRSFWRNGDEQLAIGFMSQAKKLADIAKLDLETTLVIDTTLAALQSENFEAELKKILARLDGEPIKEIEKLVIQVGIAGVVVNFRHSELLKHLKSDQKEYGYALDAISGEYIVHHGDAKEVDSLKSHWNQMPLLDGLTRLSRTCSKEKRLKEAEEHLERAVKIAQDSLEQDLGSDLFLRPFRKLISAQSSAGQHRDALALVKQYPDPMKIPELMVEVVAAIPKPETP